jgi:hypothetical protein
MLDASCRKLPGVQHDRRRHHHHLFLTQAMSHVPRDWLFWAHGMNAGLASDQKLIVTVMVSV